MHRARRCVGSRDSASSCPAVGEINETWGKASLVQTLPGRREILRGVFCLCATGQRACDTAVFPACSAGARRAGVLMPRDPDILWWRAGRCASGLCMDMINAIVLGRRPRCML